MFNYATVPTYETHQGDILTYDWTDADFILANSTCFEMSFMS